VCCVFFFVFFVGWGRGGGLGGCWWGWGVGSCAFPWGCDLGRGPKEFFFPLFSPAESILLSPSPYLSTCSFQFQLLYQWTKLSSKSVTSPPLFFPPPFAMRPLSRSVPIHFLLNVPHRFRGERGWSSSPSFLYPPELLLFSFGFCFFFKPPGNLDAFCNPRFLSPAAPFCDRTNSRLPHLLQNGRSLFQLLLLFTHPFA